MLAQGVESPSLACNQDGADLGALRAVLRYQLTTCTSRDSDRSSRETARECLSTRQNGDENEICSLLSQRRDAALRLPAHLFVVRQSPQFVQTKSFLLKFVAVVEFDSVYFFLSGLQWHLIISAGNKQYILQPVGQSLVLNIISVSFSRGGPATL